MSLTEMLPSVSAPCDDSRDDSSANYAPQEGLVRQVTTLEPATRASAIISHLDTVAREVCMADGGHVTMNPEGAAAIMGAPRDYLAPVGADFAPREVARLLRIKTHRPEHG